MKAHQLTLKAPTMRFLVDRLIARNYKTADILVVAEVVPALRLPIQELDAQIESCLEEARTRYAAESEGLPDAEAKAIAGRLDVDAARKIGALSQQHKEQEAVALLTKAQLQWVERQWASIDDHPGVTWETVAEITKALKAADEVEVAAKKALPAPEPEAASG